VSDINKCKYSVDQIKLAMNREDTFALSYKPIGRENI